MPVSEDIFRIFEAALIFFLIFFSFLKQHLLTLDETLSFLEAKGLPDSPCLPFSGPGFSHVTRRRMGNWRKLALPFSCERELIYSDRGLSFSLLKLPFEA